MPLCFTNICSAQTKKAIVIAIGEYASNEGKGWSSISSTNDTLILMPALRKQGFSSKETTLLSNKDATITNIISTFDKQISNAQKGDVFYIHFSSHGEQIEDLNDDETDGLDEAIVTYNALAPRYINEQNFQKEEINYLKDDQIAVFINALRKKIGPSGEVFIVMDNCHSGSGTRDVNNVFRGGEPPIIINSNKKTQIKEASISADNFEENEALSPYVVISASRADELNQEVKFDKNYGSLTYAISKQLAHLVSNTTYEGFYSQIKETMNQLVPQQHPVIEGNALNRKFWGGQFMTKPIYHEITKSIEQEKVYINAGMMSGLTINTLVKIYPADTYDTSKVEPLAIGSITSIKNLQACISISKNNKEFTNSAWVFVDKIFYPINTFNVSFTPQEGEKSISEKEKASYLSYLSNTPYYSKDADSKVRIVYTKGGIQFINQLSNVIVDSLHKNLNQQQFEQTIQKYCRSEYLKSYIVIDSNFQYEARILPATKTSNNTYQIDSTQSNFNGNLKIKAGTSVVISITNKGLKRIYFNVMDIEPNGKINAIMPKKNIKIYKEDLFVEPGETKTFTQFPVKIYPPYGNEVFKIFVSKSPFDLEYIGATRSVSTFSNDLEKIFNNINNTRSGQFGSNDGVVSNIYFEIFE